MSGISLPAPGSLAAVDRGCTCAAHHYGCLKIVDADVKCPLHGVVKHAPAEPRAVRDASPARLPGDAWGCP